MNFRSVLVKYILLGSVILFSSRRFVDVSFYFALMQYARRAVQSFTGVHSLSLMRSDHGNETGLAIEAQFRESRLSA